ncbi:MAG: hypothetical protein U0791_07040 [Gemmataceae bacterium]
MRKPFALALVLGLASIATSQEGRPKTEQEPPPRFGVAFKGKVYLQATPKESLNSLIEAADKGDFAYLVAHLLEPSFVDARVSDRAKQFEAQVSANLAALRDFQQMNLDKVDREARVPTDAAEFQKRVVAESRTAAFKQLVKDVQEKFQEDPETLKAMRLFRSGATFPDTPGDLVKLNHADVKDRVLFIKKIENRYFLENKQTEEAPPKEPEKK